MKEPQLTSVFLVQVDLFGETVDSKEDFAEFASLAQAAHAQIIGKILCKRSSIDPKFLIGEGKLAEIKMQLELLKPQLVIFNRKLTPSQERNLERYLQLPVWDRTQLILVIFERRAQSFAGKLQVELAQLEHAATRLVRSWTHLERQRGGRGFLAGAGETQLEADRRVLRQKINGVKKRLEKLERQRSQNRRARQRSALPTIALVGYTNAGKSTLFNGMLNSLTTRVENMLFTTLDPLMRRVYLPDFGQVIMADTVGFIRDLPHELIKAFHATLEEAREADLLLHVIDAAAVDKRQKIQIVNEVLTAIEADHLPQLQVMNKIDLIPDFAPRIDYDAQGVPTKVWIAAGARIGFDLLQQAISKKLL